MIGIKELVIFAFIAMLWLTPVVVVGVAVWLILKNRAGKNSERTPNQD